MGFFDDKTSNSAKKKLQGIPGFKMNRPLAHSPYTGVAGIEIEMEGNNLPSDGYLAFMGPESGATWASKQDGSLRGASYEYVLTRPCSKADVPVLVAGLYDQFQVNKAKLNISNRCSTHVHINVGGLKINQVTAIMCLWYTFEEILINWCGVERTTNHFCLSAKDSRETIIRWEDYLRNGTRRNLTGRDGLKYSAMNILPIFTQGSLEFRTAPAFESPVPVIQWTNFLINLREFAITNFRNPFMLASYLSERGGLALFEEVCGDNVDFKNDVLSCSEDLFGGFDRRCMEGFRRCQALVFGFPWEDWLPLIGKDYVPDPFESDADVVTATAPRIDPTIRIHHEPGILLGNAQQRLNEGWVRLMDRAEPVTEVRDDF